jgi:hypothetical protein
MRKWKIIRDLVILIYTLGITFMVGEWAIDFAYLERGYRAVGGEYLLIPMVAWVAYKVINIFFDVLEETIYAEHRSCKKVRSRRIARLRDYR